MKNLRKEGRLQIIFKSFWHNNFHRHEYCNFHILFISITRWSLISLLRFFGSGMVTESSFLQLIYKNNIRELVSDLRAVTPGLSQLSVHFRLSKTQTCSYLWKALFLVGVWYLTLSFDVLWPLLCYVSQVSSSIVSPTKLHFLHLSRLVCLSTCLL